MNAVMAGMIPVIVTMMSRDMKAMEGHSMKAEAARIQNISGEMPAHVKPTTRSLTKKSAQKIRSKQSHDTMSMTGGATNAPISAVALLTLLAPGAGLLLADLSGDLAMDQSHASEMNH